MMNKRLAFDVHNWTHRLPKKEYITLVHKYGAPSGVLDIAGGLSIWYNVPPFIDITLVDESIKHGAPKHHCDYLYSSIRFYIPLNMIEDIYSISQSIIYDQLAQKLTARCHFMAANVATLYLVAALVQNEITLPQAKADYGSLINQAGNNENIYNYLLEEIERLQQLNREQYPDMPDLNCIMDK